MADGRVTDLIELSDKRHRLRIASALGGGIAEAFAVHEGRKLPLLRPWPGAGAGVRGLGCNVLVPFSNRISGGGFAFDGQFHKVAPNLAGEPYPIHGDGFQAVWRVAGHTAQAVDLRHQGQIGPFRYSATLTHALQGDAITSRLHVTNTGPRLPFGGGFHPWFPRHADTRLRFAATGVWTETPDHLPDRHLPLSDRPDWDFRRAKALPDAWINAAFTGWKGAARVEQPSSGIVVFVEASANLDCAVVYSPDCTAGFFCFEPVSHTVDAYNQPGQPGLVVLDHGESLEMSMKLSWALMELP